jgi:RNA polymerase sigma-70 factor, ECF subfamily
VLRSGVLPVTPLPWQDLRHDLTRFVAARVSSSDVDDVVQEALVRVHHGIGGVRDSERVGAWIYQVTRNAIVDHHRKARPVAELPEDLAADAPEEDESFARLARCVTPFVGFLPAVYRQAITLVELEGLSQVEAAARLGVPISTMKARVQRGRARLRELVEMCCAIGLDARGHVLEVTPRERPCPEC